MKAFRAPNVMRCMFLLLPLALLGLTRTDEPPPFPEPHDSEKSTAQPQPAHEAAKGFKMPPGFTVEVFASEPDVRNPIAMCWDTRGRLWIAENYTYAEREKKFDLSLRDRVLIFHDTNGDGKPNERKVFIDTVQRLTSVEVGLGGVWLMCPPQLLFVPDADGDDVPDGPPQVMLEGFDIPEESYHNFANGLKWGPDGWLYGRCGASAPGNVRPSDKGPEHAVPIAGGIWRYRPGTNQFEVLCHGTTNPWGHDWDAMGECFFTNSVNGHVWHLIPGAHFRRSHTISPNPLVYEPMDTIADHWHFDTGKGWADSKNGSETVDKLGGGHAHAGCLIYNGQNWPKEYRGKLLTINLHGRRINVERLERKGSGYVAKHEADIFQASDPFFRGIDLSMGPDGSVYVIDWSDTGECHEHTGVHRNSGRIYRIYYGEKKKWQPPDLASRTLVELLHVQEQSNEWYVRHARQVFREKASSFGAINVPQEVFWAKEAEVIKKMITSKDARVRSNAIYALDIMGVTSFNLDWSWRDFIHDDSEIIRSHALQLMYQDPPTFALGKLGGTWFTEYAIDNVHGTPIDRAIQFWHIDEYQNKIKTDTPLICLSIASLMQRMKLEHRVAIASTLTMRAQDKDNPAYASTIWFGLIPVALQNPEQLTELASQSKVPRIRKWTARRFAEILAEKPACLNDLLSKTAGMDESVRRDVILGMAEGLAGIPKAAAPAAWQHYPKTFSDAATNDRVRGLEITFGDGRAMGEVIQLALDAKADLEQRKAAVRTLISANPPELRKVCEQLVRVRFLNSVAVRGLARFDDAGPLIIKSFGSFHQTERGVVVEVLCSRPAFAALLLEEMRTGRIPATLLSAGQARAIREFNQPALTAALNAVWGEHRDSPREKQLLMANLKADLTPEILAKRNKSNGRALYVKHCANCHRLFGEGAGIGPDLTGSQRGDLDYLLSNIIDPSAVVTKDFQTTRFELKDGRVLAGIITARAPASITVQLEAEIVTLPLADIEAQTPTKQSLMPDGLLQQLSTAEIRDLMAYLQSDRQVPLPE